MVTYIDTSVIIAAIDKGDERNRDAEKFLIHEKEKVISPLVLAEIFSVVSRNTEKLNLSVSVRKEDVPAVIVRLSMKKYGLRLICNYDKEFTIFGDVSAEYKLAFILAPRLKLRTLDLLHISYAWNLKMSGHCVEKFATLDGSILEKSEEIEEITGIKLSNLKFKRKQRQMLKKENC
jgi:predicted nucleic acid-binding protein